MVGSGTFQLVQGLQVRISIATIGAGRVWRNVNMSLPTVAGSHSLQNCKAESRMVGCRLENWGIMVRFSAGATGFSVHHSVHTCSSKSPPSRLCNGFQGLFP
jgi:hypothetical protein